MLNDLRLFFTNNIDKFAHFGVSLAIFLLLSLIFTPFASFILTMVIGILKEVTDQFYDWYDLVADLIGSIYGLIIYLLLKGGI